ncbi:MAG: hypothetical protein K0S27_868 [Gammaproteobacteria bacterium]|jgi:hypothetical protein|nr:hypothetical protein [Gammaproteobacteria bacterium]
MLKKILVLVLLTFIISKAYANAPVNMDIQEDIINNPFSINATQWGYQFNIKTDKAMTFVLTVDQSSEGVVNLQCWHGLEPVENYYIEPGQTSMTCVTEDAVRIVMADNRSLSATGTYSIITTP